MTKQYLTESVIQLLDHQSNDIGLYSGVLGQTLSALYVASVLENELLFDRSFEILSQTIEGIYGGKHPNMMNATLGHGLAGLGLALHCLIEDELIENDHEGGTAQALLIDIDNFVFQGTKKFLSQGNNDFWTGGQGGLWYLSNRTAKNPTAKKDVTNLKKIKPKYHTDPIRGLTTSAMGLVSGLAERCLMEAKRMSSRENTMLGLNILIKMLEYQKLTAEIGIKRKENELQKPDNY